MGDETTALFYQGEREGAQLAIQVGVEEAARQLERPRGTVFGWWKQAERLLAFRGNSRSPTLKGQGRKEIFPSVPALVTFMKDTRRDDKALSTHAMINYMWLLEPEWCASYMDSHKSSEQSLERMYQRICKRYEFTSQKPQEAKLPTVELLEKRVEFSIELWSKYTTWCPTTLFNVDETAINFDMPPTRFWAVKGRNDPARSAKMTKHTGQMTVVLTVRGDGYKLPILFIIRGMLGGDIDCDELPHYPPGHYYTVQEHAWMDAVGWRFYVSNLLKHEIDGPAVLLLDNFDSHVSEEGQRVEAEETNATVVPFPPNTTAVCQPLDVGVIGPLKENIRSKFRGVTGGTAKQKRLRAIEATIAAWEELAETTVIRSFEKAIPRYPEVLI